jgi:hypothetical protein
MEKWVEKKNMTNEEKDMPEIVISKNKSTNDYLGIIFQLGKYHDSIKLKFMDNCMDMVDAMLLGLRKSFGWLVDGEVRKVEDDNKKCIHFNEDFKNRPGDPIKRGPNYSKCNCTESGYSMCSFQVRKICKDYQQKDNAKFLINEVIIEKHGALKGL